MLRGQLDDLIAFQGVAEERSFTRAAARLSTSQAALSQAVKRLETKLDLRLLTRTTRSVAVTEAGERLLASVGPAFRDIEEQLSALTALREKPAGTIRISTMEHAAEAVLLPVLAKFLPRYPDVNVELVSDAQLTDIVKDRYDAGVRLGEQIAKDMIAVPIGPPMRMLVVGSPAYFARHGLPKRPQDLADHNCINFRLPTRGNFYPWELEKGMRKLNVRVDGQLAVNTARLMMNAAIAGLGLACVMSQSVDQEIAKGRLAPVLTDWCPAFPGYHLYYPSRQHSPAFKLLVEALRWSGNKKRSAN
jgi:DNA-binding transcriptional LysR family regulator